MFLDYYSEHLFVAQYANFNRFHFLLASIIRNVFHPRFCIHLCILENELSGESL